MGEDTTQEFPKNSLAVILARFDSLDSRMDSFDSRMDSFDLRLTALDEKVDRRLMETRPVWQQVLSRLDSVDTRLDSVDTRLDSVDTRLDSVDMRLDSVHTRFDSVDARLASVETRLDSVESRVGSVESQMGLMLKGFDRVEAEVENLGLKFRTFQGDLLRMQTRDERMAERIEKLENPPTA